MDSPLEKAGFEPLVPRDTTMFSTPAHHSCLTPCTRKSRRERQPTPRGCRAPPAEPMVRIRFPPAVSLRTIGSSGRLSIAAKEGGDLQHAAFAAMVCGTRGNRHLPWVGLENVWRLSPGADSSVPPACFRRLFAHWGGRALGRALDPRACAGAGQDFRADAFPETRRPAPVPRFWTAAR